MRDFHKLMQRIRPFAEQLVFELGKSELSATENLVQEIKLLLSNVNESYFRPTINLPDLRYF